MTPAERFIRDEAERLSHRVEARVRTFVVTGNHAVFGKVRGEFVTASVTDAQADALIEGGHVVEKSATKPAPQAVPAAPTGNADAVTHTESMTVAKIVDAPSVPETKE